MSSEPTKFDNSSFDNSLETPIQVGEKWHSTPKTVKRLLMSSEKKKAKKRNNPLKEENKVSLTNLIHCTVDTDNGLNLIT